MEERALPIQFYRKNIVEFHDIKNYCSYALDQNDIIIPLSSDNDAGFEESPTYISSEDPDYIFNFNPLLIRPYERDGEDLKLYNIKGFNGYASPNGLINKILKLLADIDMILCRLPRSLMIKIVSSLKSLYDKYMRNKTTYGVPKIYIWIPVYAITPPEALEVELFDRIVLVIS